MYVTRTHAPWVTKILRTCFKYIINENGREIRGLEHLDMQKCNEYNWFVEFTIEKGLKEKYNKKYEVGAALILYAEFRL